LFAIANITPVMDVALAILLLLPLWLAYCVWAGRVSRNPRGDIPSGIAWSLARLYVRVFHNLRIGGLEHVPREAIVNGRGVIVISNHSAGLDPILIQAALPFFVRWMMAADMRVGALEWVWEFVNVITVDRTGRADLAAVRTASRVVGTREALGIFPEGRLRRAVSELNMFQPGIGLLISRSNALVLPTVVTGTPFHTNAWSSLWRPSFSRVTFHPLIDPKALGWKASDIPGELRTRYIQFMREAGVEPTKPIDDLPPLRRAPEAGVKRRK